jgi:hypothetical protein
MSEACILLGHLMSLGRCSDGQAAMNAPILSPLQVRRSLVSTPTVMGFSNMPTVTLQAQSAVGMHNTAVGNVMGCVLKTVVTPGDDSTSSLQKSAQAIATTA